MSAPPRVAPGHVGLNVTDLARSIRFYQEIFGFDLLGRSDQPEREYAFLGYAGIPVLTLWRQSAGRAATDRPGLHHFAFQVGSMEQVRAAEARVVQAGAVLHHHGAVAHAEGAESGGIYFEDPDGIRLEVFSPTGAGGHPVPFAGAPSCGFF